MHIIPRQGERASPNEISDKSSELTYLKKDADEDMAVHNRVLNALYRLDTL